MREILMTLDLEEGSTTLTGAQLFPLGTWSHPRGKIVITPERAEKFVAQFQRQQAGQKLPILFIHSDQKNVANPLYGQAAGWITDMRADHERGVLVDIDFTEEGAAAVKSKKYRYLSAEYFDKVQLPHHTTPQEDVVVGAALVNRPHLKGMNPILNEETGHLFVEAQAVREEGGGPVDQILVMLAEQAGVNLAPDTEQLSEEQRSAIAKWLAEQGRVLSDATAQNALLQKRIGELEDPDKAKQRSLAEAGFEEEATLLSEYRADRFVRELEQSLPAGTKLTPVLAEKARAYAKDGDQKALNEALGLALQGKGIVDLSEKGTTDGAGSDDVPSDAGDRLVQLATEMSNEKKIPWHEAMELVSVEQPKLWNEYQQSLGSNKAVVGGDA